MPTQYEMQRNQMAARMGGAPMGSPGASPVMPPTQGRPRQAPVGAPQNSRLEPLLQQVMQILVDGNPTDLEEFGKFMAELQTLVQEHQGQGAPQGQPPMAGGMPGASAPPQMAR